MIETELWGPNALKVTPLGKLTAGDFLGLASQVESMIERTGQIRLLIDASAFPGWEDIHAFGAHFRFVKDHQRKVERLAVVIGHHWQRWLVEGVRMFLHPDMRYFDKSKESDAVLWIKEPQSRME